jgi:hypothetical protein
MLLGLTVPLRSAANVASGIMKICPIMALLLASTVWSGCFPWPLPLPAKKDPKPFTVQDLSFIEPGTTTRSEVLERLGEPIVQRKGGDLMVYGAVQKRGFQLILVLTVAPIEGEVWTTPHYLLIRFDQDVVESHEVIRGKTGCASDGICIGRSIAFDRETFLRFYDRKRITDKSLILYEDEASEAARRAIPVDDSCLVYVYTKKIKPVLYSSPLYIAFDSETSHIGISAEGFVLRALLSGDHLLRAGISGETVPLVDHSEGHTDFACIAGEKFFFELDVKLEDLSSGWIGQENVLVIEILPVAASSARSDIANRRLILTE